MTSYVPSWLVDREIRTGTRLTLHVVLRLCLARMGQVSGFSSSLHKSGHNSQPAIRRTHLRTPHTSLVSKPLISIIKSLGCIFCKQAYNASIQRSIPSDYSNGTSSRHRYCISRSFEVSRSRHTFCGRRKFLRMGRFLLLTRVPRNLTIIGRSPFTLQSYFQHRVDLLIPEISVSQSPNANFHPSKNPSGRLTDSFESNNRTFNIQQPGSLHVFGYLFCLHRQLLAGRCICSPSEPSCQEHQHLCESRRYQWGWFGTSVFGSGCQANSGLGEVSV